MSNTSLAKSHKIFVKRWWFLATETFSPTKPFLLDGSFFSHIHYLQTKWIDIHWYPSFFQKFQKILLFPNNFNWKWKYLWNIMNKKALKLFLNVFNLFILTTSRSKKVKFKKPKKKKKEENLFEKWKTMLQ